MRVAAFTDFGGPDCIEIQSREEPTPDSGEAVVDVEACAIGRHDLIILNGKLDEIPARYLPFISGVDVAGVVAAVGDGAPVEPGDRVVLCPNITCGRCHYCREGPETLCERFSVFHGGLAEQAVVDATRLVALPDEVPMSQAAALPAAYMTSWRMLQRAEVTAGDLVLIPGAAGGIGIAAIQLLDVVGAESIGTSSSSRKLDRVAELGADHTIEARHPDTISEAVSAIGDPDAAIDHLGGDYTGMAARVLRRGGQLLVCGYTVDHTPSVDTKDLTGAQKTILGHMMGTQPDLERLVNLVADGAFAPAVHDEYSLDDARQAFADLQERTVVGKLVLRP